jgi:hypothetical protein
MVLRDFEFAVVLQVKTALLTEPVFLENVPEIAAVAVLVPCETDRFRGTPGQLHFPGGRPSQYRGLNGVG